MAPSRSTRRLALLACAHALVTVLACAGLLTVAALASAPPPALAFVIAVCVGYPMLVGSQLPAALATLGRGPLAEREVDRLLVELDRLPETQHPLGY